MRGLKPKDKGNAEVRPPVAPLVGAWIETRQLATYPVERDVAPLVGAWIETTKCPANLFMLGSRTPRGCVD